MQILLNQVIGLRMLASLSEKLNLPAVKEILSNRESFPQLSDFFPQLEHMLSTHDFSFCDREEKDTYLSIDQVISFYEAFVRAFFKSERKHSLRSLSCSKGIAKEMNLWQNLSSPEKLLELYSATITPTKTYLSYEKKLFSNQGKPYLENKRITLAGDHRQVLKKISEECSSVYTRYSTFKMMEQKNLDPVYSFDQEGYLYYRYELVFDDSYLGQDVFVFYSTERGFDPYCTFHLPMKDVLSTLDIHDEILDILGLK